MSLVRPRGATAMRPAWQEPRGGLVRRALPGASRRADLRARGPVRPKASGVIAFLISQLSWVAALGVVGCHLALGYEEYPLIARALLAVPALIAIVEARGYLRKSTNELPFIVFAMVQFYVSFGFPVLFDIPFFDLGGPVFFTESTRTAAAIAVVLGALCLWGGARMGALLGPGLLPLARKTLPPETVGERWDEAFYIFASATILVSVLFTFAPRLIPGQLGQAAGVIFQLEFVLGIAVVHGPRTLGPRVSWALLVFSTLLGMARGQLDPIARAGMAFIAARWVTLRRIPVVVIGAMIALFLILQPLKYSYREQVWGQEARTGQSTNVGERVTAWQNAITNASANESRKRSEGGTVDRLCEFNPVMHAMLVVPQRIPYLYGQSFVEVLYSLVPRLIWPDKPTSIQGISQRYAVIFGLQTERGSQTTAIGMNLLVEGYWNFGWIGIALLCFAAGLVVGSSQAVFSGDHWALRAIGIAQIATLTINSTVVLTYSSLFQFTVGRLLAVWGIYWIARLLSRRTQSARGGFNRRLARR